MIKLSKQHYVISLALLAALILAFFPTTAFISRPYMLNTQLSQQHENLTGLFTITPFKAAQYYSYKQKKAFWIDVRDAEQFSKSHLKIAVHQTLSQLENTQWNPDDLILIYGNNTRDAQEAVAYLRQVKNARAFAVVGGFPAVKKYLIDPIGISVTNRLSDKSLTTLIELRNKLSGENVSPEQMLKNLKSSKSKAIREGC